MHKFFEYGAEPSTEMASHNSWKMEENQFSSKAARVAKSFKGESWLVVSTLKRHLDPIYQVQQLWSNKAQNDPLFNHSFFFGKMRTRSKVPILKSRELAKDKIFDLKGSRKWSPHFCRVLTLMYFASWSGIFLILWHWAIVDFESIHWGQLVLGSWWDRLG